MIELLAMVKRLINAAREAKGNKIISSFGLGLFYRTLGILLVPCIIRTGVSATFVTLTGGFIGVMAGFVFAGGSYPFLIIGTVLSQTCLLIDYTDGGVARARGEASNYGDWLDCIVDRVVDASVFFGLCWGHYRVYGQVEIWVWGFVAIALRTMIGAFTHITELYVPRSLAMIKSDLKSRGIQRLLKLGAFSRVNLYCLIAIFCLLDRVYLLMVIVSLYGGLFYFGSIAYLHDRVKAMAEAPKEVG